MTDTDHQHDVAMSTGTIRVRRLIISLTTALYDNDDLDTATARRLVYLGNAALADDDERAVPAPNGPAVQREIDHVDWSLYLDTQEWTTNDELAAIIVAGLPPRTPTDTEIVDRIFAVLWPEDDPFAQWSSDEIGIVGNLIGQVRDIPKEV